MVLPENQTHISGILSQQPLSWTSRPNESHCHTAAPKDNYTSIRYLAFFLVTSASRWKPNYQETGRTRALQGPQSNNYSHADHTDREEEGLTWSTLFHWPEISMWMWERWTSPVWLLVSYQWKKNVIYCVRAQTKKLLYCKKEHGEKHLIAIITFTGLGENCHICKRGSTEPFVAPEKAAFNCDHELPDVTPWIRCIVGNVATRFWNTVHWFSIVMKTNDQNRWSTTRDIHLLCSTRLPFQKPGAYITHHAT